MFAWEDVKAMFNGGSRKRVTGSSSGSSGCATPATASTTSSQSPCHSEEVAKPVQEPAPVKTSKSSKNPCPSKRLKYDNGHLNKIRTPEDNPTVVATGSSTSNSPSGPIPVSPPVTPQVYQHPSYHSQSLLARLNSIANPATTPVGSILPKPADPPLQDYSMMWSAAAGASRLWSPYLNPLPFHPYSYYNYLINKTDQFSSLMMNHSGAGWQHLVTNKTRMNAPISIVPKNGTEDGKTLQVISSIDEDDGETFVDVESTDPSAPPVTN